MSIVDRSDGLRIDVLMIVQFVKERWKRSLDWGGRIAGGLRPTIEDGVCDYNWYCGGREWSCTIAGRKPWY